MNVCSCVECEIEMSIWWQEDMRKARDKDALEAKRKNCRCVMIE